MTSRMFCPVHARTSGRISLDCSAGPPGRIAIEDKTGGEQRRHDQRIGAAMGVFRVAQAIGQVGAAPEISQIEPALQREQCVEQDQRTRHRLDAEQLIQIRRLGRDGGAGLRLP